MSDKLTKQLEKMETTYESYKKDFARDGKITRDEAVILKSVSTKLDALRAKVRAYNESQGVVDFSDEPIEVKSDVKSYDDAIFATAFNKSIKDWSQDGNIALNRVKTYFMKTDKPKGLGVSEVLSVAGLIFSTVPQAKAVIGTMSAVAGLVKAAYQASLPATPSLNEIHSSWAVALHKYGAQDHTKEFQQFQKEWKKQNGVPDDVYEVPVNEFLPACAKFAAKYMPTNAQVEKVFLTKILSHVEGGMDWDSRGSLKDAGVADIRLIELAGNYSQPAGDLDDVSEQLLEAVKTVWSKNRIVDLPVQINFTIRNINMANMAEIERSSSKPGDTGFRLRSGKKEIFDSFMKTKAYNIPMVRDLSVD